VEDDSLWTVIGVIVAVGFLYLGSQIRSRSRNRPRRPPSDESS
jgi:hypothetical protein